MEEYILIFILIGIIGLAMPWATSLLDNLPINYPIVSLALGIIVFSLPLNLPDPDPIEHENIILRLSELAVIISLMGTGLKLNKNFTLKNYRAPLLLVFVTMILCIAAVAFTGWMWAGFVPASALLLGAVFAPTDPVIADNVQVDFDTKQEPPVKFSLTAEAGMNDGMAFPFTWLAVWAAIYGLNDLSWIGTWALFDVLYRIVAAIIVGAVLGRLFAIGFLKLPDSAGWSIRREFIIIAATLLIYGLTEAIHGYGFIAVFIAGLAIRHFEREHDFHESMYDFVDQTEKIFLAVILFVLGGYTVHYLFDHITIESVLLVMVSIFIIRPVFAFLPIIKNSEFNFKDKLVVAFMGMKGVGSLFYLAFALHETPFKQKEVLWATVAFLVFVSVIVHGIGEYVVKPIIDVEEEELNDGDESS